MKCKGYFLRSDASHKRQWIHVARVAMNSYVSCVTMNSWRRCNDEFMTHMWRWMHDACTTMNLWRLHDDASWRIYDEFMTYAWRWIHGELAARQCTTYIGCYGKKIVCMHALDACMHHRMNGIYAIYGMAWRTYDVSHVTRWQSTDQHRVRPNNQQNFQPTFQFNIPFKSFSTKQHWVRIAYKLTISACTSWLEPITQRHGVREEKTLLLHHAQRVHPGSILAHMSPACTSWLDPREPCTRAHPGLIPVVSQAVA